MTQQEFSTFAMAIRTYYPRENILPNKQSMELWYEQVQDLPYDIANLALKEWVLSNKWSPAICDIREYATRLLKGEAPDWGAEWEKVRRIAREEYSEYAPDKAQEALDTLDDVTRQVALRIGIRTIAMSENIEVERANFRMMYEPLAQRRKHSENMPDTIRQAIEQAMPKREEIAAKGGPMKAIPVFADQEKDDSTFTEELRKRFL